MIYVKKTNFFGFWAEHCGNGYPALSEQLKDELSESESILIAKYLDSCPVWISSPGLANCPFDGSVSGSRSVITDGDWAWEATMAYYVREYRISPPLEFIQHVQNKLYIPPSEKDIDLSQLDFPESV